MPAGSDRHNGNMDEYAALSQLTVGQQAVIAGVSLQAEERRRLRELGIIDGVRAECVLRRKGIGAYLVRGTVIALRDADSTAVQINLMPAHQSCEEGGCAVCL